MEWPPSQPAGMRRACVPSWGWMCRDAPSFTERVRNRSPSRPAGSECFCLRPSCPAPGPWPLLAQLNSHLLWLLLASSPPCFLHSYYRLPKLLALSSLNWFSAKPLFVPLLRPLWAVPGASAPPPPAQPRAPPPPLRPICWPLPPAATDQGLLTCLFDSTPASLMPSLPHCTLCEHPRAFQNHQAKDNGNCS